VTRTALPASVMLLGEPRDVHVARAFTRRMLAQNGCTDWHADDAVLVVSELVTNAIVYGRPPMNLSVTVQPDEVVVAVSDSSNSDPFARLPDDDDEGGRGVAIVEQLSETWWVEHGNGRKSVIARVRLHRPDS
jgi:anti-sigma regulatory factor (Ser/Thr protein kinase)